MRKMTGLDRLRKLFGRGTGLKRGWWRDERGSILLFTTVAVVPIMIVMGGLAMDVAYYASVDAELQKSMDAAALAGAGKLGFNDSVFPTVRQTAIDYASRNNYRNPPGGTINLDRNSGNAVGGDIVLGNWNGDTRIFDHAVAPSRVNAVRCQTTSQNLQIPTSFLRLLGLGSLPVAADAIAVSNPPAVIPPDACLFPIGVSQCPFRDADGNFGAQGCGQPISTFTPATTNTATWVNINGTGTPGATITRQAVSNAANGTGCNGSTLQAGSDIGAQGGMDQAAFDDISRCSPGSGTSCEGFFNTKFTDGPIYTVKDARGNVTYQGHGWEVIVPVITFDCSGSDNGNGTRQILTFSRMVITQVINRGWCGVANHYAGNLWDSHCPMPNGTSSEPRDSNFRAVFGYYECRPFEGVPPVVNDAPRAGLATRLRLVQ
jgi:Flp pilus assembly protein TadG